MDEEEKIPFTDHLEELRERIVKSFIAVAIGFVGGFHPSFGIVGGVRLGAVFLSFILSDIGGLGGFRPFVRGLVRIVGGDIFQPIHRVFDILQVAFQVNGTLEIPGGAFKLTHGPAD